ncbi:hypothetical protein E2L06_15005 [Haloterrigena sp. H1]|uniref:hypothetical protein n=1 Tax=Haloterrigena sp. H1 TaxID=2552943 RepID=UPI00110EB217|nr:hypothetical protein [Haloterrigena sp. H1]TMT87823.1 hypothetical protein E2L06_15005 [Haloterrigena sp. H1]
MNGTVSERIRDVIEPTDEDATRLLVRIARPHIRLKPRQSSIGPFPEGSPLRAVTSDLLGTSTLPHGTEAAHREQATCRTGRVALGGVTGLVALRVRFWGVPSLRRSSVEPRVRHTVCCPDVPVQSQGSGRIGTD